MENSVLSSINNDQEPPIGQPKAHFAYEALRDAILAMRLPPGAAINEKKICTELNISRTPLREAVLRLNQEGLIRVVPSGGTFINNIDIKKIIEGHLVRTSLELQIVSLAAKNYEPRFDRDLNFIIFRQQEALKSNDADEAFSSDNDFHKLLCKIAGFPHIWQTIHSATGQLDRMRRQAIPIDNYLEEIVTEHLCIYDALKIGDSKAATHAMQAHLSGLKDQINHLVLNNENCQLTANDKKTLEQVSYNLNSKSMNS